MGIEEMIQAQVDVYNTVGHSLNTAYLYRVYEDQKQVDLVLELCTGGELWSRIQVNHYTETGEISTERIDADRCCGDWGHLSSKLTALLA